MVVARTRRPRPLRRRVSTSIIAITSIAVALFALPLGVAISQVYRGQAIADLQRDATRIAVTVSDSFGTDGSPLTLPADLPADVTVGVYGIDGKRLAAAGPLDSTLAASTADGHLHTAVEGSDLVAYAPVPSDGTVALSVRVARPYAVLRTRVLTAWVLMALFATLVIGVAAQLARWQAGQISRPLEQLTGSARALGEGDFTIRPTPSGIEEADALGATLQATARRLGDLLEREKTFSADVSHQLRTPLTALLLGLESALARPDADLRETTSTAISRGEQLRRIVDDLITLARDTHHTDSVLDLDQLLDNLRERWHAPFAAAGRQLTFTPPAQTPPATANARAVRQILDVLLDNALVHGAGHTRVTIADSGSGIAIEVTDEGAGLTGDPEAAFNRRSEPGEHGIGLALARRLAEADGGRLVLRRSAPGPAFSLLLPATGHPGDTS